MKDLVELRKLKEETSNLRVKISKIERDFGKWLESHENWKLWVIGIIAESSNRFKYNHTRRNLQEDILPIVRNIEFYSGNKMSFEIKTVDWDYIPTGVFDMSRLEVIDSFIPAVEDIENRIEIKKERLKSYKEELSEIKRRISTEEKEIENLETWINKGI